MPEVYNHCLLGEWGFLDAIFIFIANYMILINRGFINKSLDALCKIVSNSFYQGLEDSKSPFDLTTGPLPVVDLFILCEIFIERISLRLLLLKSSKSRTSDKRSVLGFFLAFLNKQIYVLKIHVLKNKC